MTESATDFGQEAYGLFYFPLTEQLKEQGIDAINPQQHGFSGRWRTFHTGYEGIVYMLALDEEGQDSAGLRFADKQLHRPIYETLRQARDQIQKEMPAARVECIEYENVLWIGVSKDADDSAPVPQRFWTRDWMFANLISVKNALQLRLSRAMQGHPS